MDEFDVKVLTACRNMLNVATFNGIDVKLAKEMVMVANNLDRIITENTPEETEDNE